MTDSLIVKLLQQTQGGHSPGKPAKVGEFQSGQGNWNLPFGLRTSWRVEFAAFVSLWAWTFVAFSKLVTMLVIINVKQRLFKRYAVYRKPLPAQATG